MAIFKQEPGFPILARALSQERSFLITPALVEFYRTSRGPRNLPRPEAVEIIETLRNGKMAVIPFEIEDAEMAAAANPIYGSGNESGGKLNMLDLMVYGAAKVRELPILCTGYDFRSTDAIIHPASRLG